MNNVILRPIVLCGYEIGSILTLVYMHGDTV